MAVSDRDLFNINVDWLTKISRQIDIYLLSQFQDDFDGMFKSLDLLELLISPKIENDEVELLLTWLEENKEKGYIKDDKGLIVRKNNEHIKEIHKNFRKCFRLILLKMDEEGILTKLKLDPGKAMSKFDG